VPLHAILRHRTAAGSSVPTRLLYSVRSQREIIYRGELEALAGDALEIRYTLTCERPPGWSGYLGRIDDEILRALSWPPAEHPVPRRRPEL